MSREVCAETGGRFVPAAGWNLETGNYEALRPPSPSSTPSHTRTRTPTATAKATPTNTLTPTPKDTTTFTPTPPLPIRLHPDIFRLDDTELRDDEAGNPDDEEVIGSMMCVNNDNDD